MEYIGNIAGLFRATTGFRSLAFAPKFWGMGGEESEGLRFVRVEGFFGFRNLYGAQGLALQCVDAADPHQKEVL